MYLLERGQEGSLDVLILISMGAPGEDMAGPPVKLRQSRFIHFSKVEDGKPWVIQFFPYVLVDRPLCSLGNLACQSKTIH